MKKINKAAIVRDLRFESEQSRNEYLEKQTTLAERKHQPKPWAFPYKSPDPDFPFGVVCGTAYNSNPMWEP